MIVLVLQDLKKNVSFLVALFFAILSAIFIYVSIQATRPTVPVVVSTCNLSVGEKITTSSVTSKKFPAEAVPGTAVQDIRSVIGRTVAAGPILAGDIVRTEHLSARGSLTAILATYAPEGWVAIELPQETGRGMHGIRRGDIVNVFAEIPGEKGTVIDLVVKEGIVIATPWSTVGSESQDSGTKNFVVAVKPEDTPALATLLVQGKKAALALVTAGGYK